MNPLDRYLAFTDAEIARLARHDPRLYLEFREQVEHRIVEREREACEGSLWEFIKRAWKEVDPAELHLNWHHEEICEQLEAVVRGEVRQLVINIPPRHTKTLIVNVFFPAGCGAGKRQAR